MRVSRSAVLIKVWSRQDWLRADSHIHEPRATEPGSGWPVEEAPNPKNGLK
jgi:hypothetical protein